MRFLLSPDSSPILRPIKLIPGWLDNLSQGPPRFFLVIHQPFHGEKETHTHTRAWKIFLKSVLKKKKKKKQNCVTTINQMYKKIPIESDRLG